MTVSSPRAPKAPKIRRMAMRKSSSRSIPRLRGHAVRAVDRGRRYRASMVWLIRHGLLRRRSSFSWLVVLSVASLGSQVLAVGVIFQYVKLMEGSGSVPVANARLDWLHSHYGLLVFVASVGVLLGFNHLTLYRVRIMAINWARDTETYCGRLALALAARLPDLSRPAATARATDRELRSLLMVSVRYSGMTVRLMVLSLPTVIALAGSVLGLLIVDWAITCAIVALGAVIFLFQYPASLKGANATRRWQALRPEQVKRTLAAIESMRLGSSPSDNTSRQPTDLYSEPTVIKSIDSYGDRMRAIEVGTLATQMSTTLLIAAIILFIGHRALTGDASWAVLVAYITLLRVASGSFSGLTRYVTSMARLYPQVQDFVGYVTAFAQAERPDLLRSRAWALRVKLSGDTSRSKAGLSGFATIERARIAALVALDPRYAARPDFAVTVSSQICPSELPEQRPRATVVADDDNSWSGTSGAVSLIACGRMQTAASLRQALGLSDDHGSKDWRCALDELRHIRPDLTNDIDACTAADLERPWRPTVTADLAGLIAQFAAALVRRASVVIVERDALETLGCRSAEDPLIIRLGRDSLIAIWYQRSQLGANGAPDFGEDYLLVCAGTEIKASVDLTARGSRAHLAAILSAITSEAEKASAYPSSARNLDDAMADLD